MGRIAHHLDHPEPYSATMAAAATTMAATTTTPSSSSSSSFSSSSSLASSSSATITSWSSSPLTAHLPRPSTEIPFTPSSPSSLSPSSPAPSTTTSSPVLSLRRLFNGLDHTVATRFAHQTISEILRTGRRIKSIIKLSESLLGAGGSGLVSLVVEAKALQQRYRLVLEELGISRLGAEEGANERTGTRQALVLKYLDHAFEEIQRAKSASHLDAVNEMLFQIKAEISRLKVTPEWNTEWISIEEEVVDISYSLADRGVDMTRWKV